MSSISYPLHDELQAPDGVSAFGNGASQPPSGESRIAHGEAHRRHVVTVADGADTDYIALCSCGWVSLPHLSPEAAWREPCELAVLLEAVWLRAARYLPRIASALTKWV